MPRDFSTTRAGGSFARTIIGDVWEKGVEIESFDGREYRYDRYGALMRFSEYGNVKSVYGWEVDHIKPVAKGGSDDISNLQPLQWQNNRQKGDRYGS